MTVYDHILVGGGLFGQIIHDRLTKMGSRGLLIDDRRELAGSRPAACLMKPSWAAKTMTNRDYDAAIELLDEQYCVRKVRLSVVGKAGIDCHWVPPRKILGNPLHVLGMVERIQQIDQGWEVFATTRVKVMSPNVSYQCRRLVLACGVWAGELCPSVASRVYGRGGWAFTWDGHHLDDPFLKVWAPYRQLVAFNRQDEEVWVGDGSALLPERLDDGAKMLQSRQRCMDAVGEHVVGLPTKTLRGIRPYFTGSKDPALVESPEKGLWVATGGAKNGTLGAAWAARRISEATK